jgi:hypothetical protein
MGRMVSARPTWGVVHPADRHPSCRSASPVLLDDVGVLDGGVEPAGGGALRSRSLSKAWSLRSLGWSHIWGAKFLGHADDPRSPVTKSGGSVLATARPTACRLANGLLIPVRGIGRHAESRSGNAGGETRAKSHRRPLATAGCHEWRGRSSPPSDTRVEPHARREGAGYSIDLEVGVCIAVSGATSFRK